MRPLRLARWVAFLALLLPAGCLTAHKRIDELPIPPETPINPADLYTLACPDVIEVIFLDWPDVTAKVKIGTDGCVRVGNLTPLRAEGLTAADAARAIAERTEIAPNRVRVNVSEYNSRQVLLYGQVNGEPRVIDYRGPETVIDLLARAGGLAADAAPNEVHVVRAHLGEGVPAEVLRVDLAAIRDRHDGRTNIHVQPLDEVYVGEATRSRIGKVVPDFLKPFYEGVVSFIPERTVAPPRSQPPEMR
jgi:protein involved in polysaccharide export with SLBB domain